MRLNPLNGAEFKQKLRKPSKAKEPENILQKRVESYLTVRQIKYLHIPDILLHHLRTNSPAHIAKISSDAFKGVPDIIAFKNDNLDFLNCLALELKTELGKLSQGQKNWHKGLNVKVAYGWDEAKEIIDEWIKS